MKKEIIHLDKMNCEGHSDKLISCLGIRDDELVEFNFNYDRLAFSFPLACSRGITDELDCDVDIKRLREYHSEKLKELKDDT